MPPLPAHRSHGTGSCFRPEYSAAPTAAVTAPPTMTSCGGGEVAHGQAVLMSARPTHTWRAGLQSPQCHERQLCSAHLERGWVCGCQHQQRVHCVRSHAVALAR
jgi:hypothetical protein